MRACVELVVAVTENIEVRLEPLVGLILKEVTNGTVTMLDSGGRLLDARVPRPARNFKDAGVLYTTAWTAERFEPELVFSKRSTVTTAKSRACGIGSKDRHCPGGTMSARYAVIG